MKRIIYKIEICLFEIKKFNKEANYPAFGIHFKDGFVGKLTKHVVH